MSEAASTDLGHSAVGFLSAFSPQTFSLPPRFLVPAFGISAFSLISPTRAASVEERRIKNHFPAGLIFLLCALCWSPFVRAQVVNDGATNTLNHVTNTFSGGVTVGTNGSFTLLILTNAALLTNSGAGVIGLNAGANSNTVRLTGANTRWTMALNLSVGNNGSFNRLLLTNAAMVGNGFGALGIGTTSSNNEAWVTGSGSIWSNLNDLYVGYVGQGNRLVVTNGGLVGNDSGLLGIDPTSDNNQATVTGAGSLWSNRVSLYVGYSGSGNRLVVTNSGAIFASSNVYVGLNGGSVSNLLLLSSGAVLTNGGDGLLGLNVGADANTVFLSGTNTSWLMGANLLLGSNGAFNQLVISNGARVASGIATLGSSAASGTNLVLVTGPGSVWSNSGNLNLGLTFDSNRGGNRLVISNGGFVASRFGIIGGGNAGNSNLVIVTGTNSIWTNQFAVEVGYATDGNHLTVSDGARVFSQSGSIGTIVGSQNNDAVITGGGSSWIIASGFSIGAGSAGNRLVLTNGGSLSASNVFLGNSFPGAGTNRLVVDGGALWVTSASQTAPFGLRGGTNQFNSGRIEADQLLMTNTTGLFEFNGGLLVTRSATISNGASFVVGVGGVNPAVWDVRAGPASHFIAGNLLIGTNSSFNQLLITNAATLTNTGAGFLGFNAGASSNSAFLSGGGSQWLMPASVVVGESGAFNQMVVANGAVVASGLNGVLGALTTSSNNQALVTGAGSLWRMGSDLFVGENGSANRLIVTNGGTVVAFNALFLGGSTNSINNRIIVDGGALRVTNESFSVEGGTNVLNAGEIDAPALEVISAQGVFEFNGGTLQAQTTIVTNGRVFFVGNGASAATLDLAGNGVHRFANGLAIRSNAFLIGNGTIIGTLTVQNGGTLAPGASLGILTLNDPPILQGRTVMKISNNGSMLPNDQVAFAGTLTYGGALIVTNIGPNALTAGVEFPLFNANSYSGSFSSLTLPPLDPGLTWTNQLLVNGSIQVIGIAPLKFASILLSGTNLIISGAGGPTNGTYWVLASTNLLLPRTNWPRLLTNHFDASGDFIFTNALSSTVRQRFYQLQLP